MTHCEQWMGTGQIFQRQRFPFIFWLVVIIFSLIFYISTTDEGHPRRWDMAQPRKEHCPLRGKNKLWKGLRVL